MEHHICVSHIVVNCFDVVGFFFCVNFNVDVFGIFGHWVLSSVRIGVAHLCNAIRAFSSILHNVCVLRLVFLSYLYAKVQLFPDMCKHIPLICVNISLIYVNTFRRVFSVLATPLFLLCVLRFMCNMLKKRNFSAALRAVSVYILLHLRESRMLTKT